MTTLYLDLETFSEVPIPHGTHRYAEKAEIMLVAYAFDDGPVVVDDLTAIEVPTIWDRMHAADTVVIHNSAFDRTVLNYQGVYLWPGKTHDTMVMAMQHGLPGGLAKLCEILRVPLDKAKDKEGKALIQLFCKPRPKTSKIRRATRETHPEKWQQFIDYARLDIEAMRDIYKKLPKWNHENAQERELWLLDQDINDRGVAIDTDLVEAAITQVAAERERLNTNVAEMTDGELRSALQRDATIKYILEAFDVPMEDLTVSTVENMLADDNYPPELHELLRNRLQVSSTSTTKWAALQRSTSSDGRLRGTLQFCGASRTGRWAGRLFQPQNLPRPRMSADCIESGIAALKDGTHDELVNGSIMDLASNALRGAIVAAPGKKLVVADLSNIEGRVLAWLAGEQWKLDAFAAFDAGHGEDLYKITAGSILGKEPKAVTKDERQSVGKVSELALGYQGGVGAFLTFATAYHLDLDELARLARGALKPHVLNDAAGTWEWMKKTKRNTFGLDQDTWVAIDAIKRTWRLAHPMISELWDLLENAVRNVVGADYGEAQVGDFLRVDKRGAWLRIRLPSGRYLCYPAPRVDEQGKISYLGVNQYSRRFERISTYGGKLAENVTQAVARDVLAEGMLAADAEGYRICLSVHDELITETDDEPFYTAEMLARIMTQRWHWAPGLPLAAAGFEAKRYRKE